MRNVARFIPAIDWLRNYRRGDFPSDVVAGLVTAVMLIPQSMAYAQIAGLPPQVGLYASVLPLAVYALLGTSRQLSVGPVAITSLAVFAGVGALAEPGSARYIQLVLMLAVMIGAVKLLLGVLRLGVVMNFVSHPVLQGFTSASALIIAVGQLKFVAGFALSGEHIHQQLWSLVSRLNQINGATVAVGVTSIVVLMFFRTQLRGILTQRTTLPKSAVTLIVSGAPLVTVLLGTLIAQAFQLDSRAAVSIVGAIPQGFQPAAIPTFTLADLEALAPTIVTVVFISVVESIAVARALAAKRRQSIDSNQELIALGAANIAAGLTGGYPVTGGFARSVVNDQAGAQTGLASLITAGSIGLIILFFTPLFYFLPQAVLSATVIVAVSGLINLKEPLHIWQINRSDAVTWGVTFLAVLLIGVEAGILAGVVSSLVLFIWRSSRPHYAVVGRVPGTEHYRNVLRHQVETWPHVLAVRIDESLYFANAAFLEERLMRLVVEHPAVRALVLIGSAVNFIDASAAESLQSLKSKLQAAGVELHLADIKGPVMDRLERAHLVEMIGREHFHLSTHDAMRALGCVA